MIFGAGGAGTNPLTIYENAPQNGATRTRRSYARGIYLGADVDSLGDANRQGDGIHPSDVRETTRMPPLWAAIFAAEY
jgi:hypothetical protein